jgi:hypothetical protein
MAGIVAADSYAASNTIDQMQWAPGRVRQIGMAIGTLPVTLYAATEPFDANKLNVLFTLLKSVNPPYRGIN